MSSILKKASRNFLYRHPWQLCLAILGITLGVAVVVAIDLTLESSLQTFTQTAQALSGKASHRIVASDGGLDEKVRDLRASGCIVIKQLSGQHAYQPACNQKLEKIDENWVLVPLN